MQVYLDLDIRQRLVTYLTAEMTLRAFQEWYLPATWPVNTRRHGAVEDLVNRIDLRLAEFTSGHWSEDELKEQLRPLVQNYRGDLVVGQNGGAPSPAIRFAGAGSWTPADKQSVGASG